MAAVKGLLLGLVDDLEVEMDHYHLWAQVRRVAGVFVGALALQFTTSGTRDWTWKSLGAVVLAAGYVTARQVWPTIPWATVKETVLAGGSTTQEPSVPGETPQQAAGRPSAG